MKDIRAHWSEWRLEWERKLTLNEMQFLRSVADLQLAFQHRAMLMESNFRDIAKSQHQDYRGRARPQHAGYPEAPLGRPGKDPRGI